MLRIKDLFEMVYNTSYQNVGYEANCKLKVYDKTLFILFQHSQGKVDWKRNFSFSKKPYKYMHTKYKVHKGFLEAWLIIKPRLEKHIMNKNYDRIIIAGYSHGGALAMLCHEYVWFNRPDLRPRLWTYAFEGPRVYAGFRVKKGLRERWDHFTLIRNDNDLVTHVPPHIFGFCHVGNILEIGRFRGNGRIDSHRPEEVKANLDNFNLAILPKVELNEIKDLEI